MDDLIEKLKKVREPFMGRLKNQPVEMVVDDIILLSTGELIIKVLLYVCTQLKMENPSLEWQSKKCKVLSNMIVDNLSIGNGKIVQTKYSPYLGIRL